jgi:hypothetical protein
MCLGYDINANYSFLVPIADAPRRSSRKSTTAPCPRPNCPRHQKWPVSKGEEEFFVERILGKQAMGNDRFFYLVKWDGKNHFLRGLDQFPNYTGPQLTNNLFPRL